MTSQPPQESASGPGEDRPAPAVPGVRASDAERETAVARLQMAVGEGRLDLGEFAERVDQLYAGTTVDQVAAVLADLPAAGVELIGERRAVEPVTSVFGDIRLTAAAAPGRCRTVFGDVRLDLRDLRTSADTVEVWVESVFGDVDVLVSDGVDAELRGSTIFGERRTELAAVPRVLGTPRIVVHTRTFFGDIRLRSLPQGESPSRWRALLRRLDERITPPAPPPGGPAA